MLVLIITKNFSLPLLYKNFLQHLSLLYKNFVQHLSF